MKWKDEYRLGIDEIDMQHKTLLGHIAGIEMLLVKEGEDWFSVYSAIGELKQYAHLHFKIEEALMRMYGFAESVAHQLNHESFFVQLDRIEMNALRNCHDASCELLDFLQDWLIQHMTGIDRNYANYILGGAKPVSIGSHFPTK